MADQPKPLVFLHLSDIHFQVPKGGGKYELDGDLRNELERDAERLAGKLGAPHAVLVTGDVAFRGDPDEYKIARDWLLGPLREKAKYAGGESIICIPGNHDVDRTIVKRRRPIRDCHGSLRNCRTSTDLHEAIVEYLEDPWVFYEKIENYNRFAFEFECDLSKDDPYIEEEFKLNDGSKLRVRGINSTLVSDDRDDDGHVDRKLVVGQHQCQLKSESGIEYMSACHHPPDWLIDGQMVDDWLNRRARIQLFGHKHVQKLKENEGRLRISAGAVHPDRREPDWKPRYNWITLMVNGTGDARKFVVEVFPRLWHDGDKKFDVDFQECKQKESRVFELPIDSWHPPVEAPPSGDGVRPVVINDPPPMDTPPMSPSMDPARTLAHRFLSLSYVRRLSIAQALGLIKDEDELLPEREKSKQMFIRAKEKRLLGKLWDAVEQQHSDGKHPKNPFS